ncbi:NMA111 [[Candida] subhashii]|uniref:Pro-apoptotic serine protease NMA111 n=1 Tax=[Candida] subhashii TaxID=561895 RepID=A0A8J5QIE3_9ASCO|nr:NMA111 [[Candida] subhashii]KAG7661373.1 NMA111 [[Candida] subhashii]
MSHNPLKREADSLLNGQVKKRIARDQEDETSESDSNYSDIEQPVFDVPVTNSKGWQQTITKVVKSVVSVHFSNVAHFDTETALCSEATGFVVDLERGLILTNRHVVGPGPFTGYVVFDNHESVDVKPIYRDPIHDFGFLKFDPKEVKYLKLGQLDLEPELAKIGTEIRVVGNDAGEKLSILAGIISRLDRNAPDYGSLTYNDFNTEYIQAAASATGGSSGSPVVNEDGKCVALQAGGSTEASTDFFLPVYRPKRALKCIQEGKPITRGDIQVEWQLRPFNECVRLGLTSEAEAKARELFPNKIGLLVAELVLPEGPADGLLKEGDCLISINGEYISTFIRVDEILDENVGKELEFVVQRGGQEIKQTIKVGDLHAITPDRFVQVAGASFHNLSYQVAKCYGLPVRGVFTSNGSGSFLFSSSDPSGWLMETIDDKPVPNLDEFVEVMKNIPDYARVPVTYRHVSDMHCEYVQTIYIDRHWDSSFKMAVRNDETGLWDFTTLQEKPLEPITPQPQNAKYIDIPINDDSKKGCSSLVKSFVQVRAIIPHPIDSHNFRKGVCYGVVIDAKNGFVLVSRRYVPHDMCDISLIFAESIDVVGKVVFMHPHLNYAIIKYDPSLVLADVKTPKFGTTPLERNDKSFIIGYNSNLRLITEDVKISSVSSLNVGACPTAPRYRGTNLEVILLNNKIAHECDAAILVDDDGTVRAFWLTYLGENNEVTYRMGLDVTDVKDVIDLLQANKIPKNLRILDAEFASMTVFNGRARGVSQEWITKYEEASHDRIRFLAVDRVAASSLGQPASPLKTGDIVLSVNGKLVKSMRDFSCMYEDKSLEFRIVRQKKEMTLQVPTIDTSTLDTSHVVFWSGALLQTPHYSVRQLMREVPSEVYVTEKSPAGPASQYGIPLITFITHVNDQETKTLDTFIKVVRDIPDRTFVKLRLVTFDNLPVAITLKTDYHYFPTTEFKKPEGSEKWIEIEYERT